MNEDQQLPEPKSILVPSDQLAQIIAENRELKAIFGNTVELLMMMSELFGGNIPTSPMSIAMKLPKIIKNLNKDQDFLNRAGDKLAVIKAIAPKYLAPELLTQLRLTDGNDTSVNHDEQ